MIKLLCILAFLCFACPSPSFSQDTTHVVFTPYKTTNITVDKFEWQLDTITGKVKADITVTNRSSLHIKAITIQLTGKNKGGVMLQSGVQTISQSAVRVTIGEGETRKIRFDDAYNNIALYELTLKNVKIEYTNGALEGME